MKSKGRISSVLIVVGLFAVLKSSSAQSSESSSSESSSSEESSEELLTHGLDQHNRLREAHDSPPMELDDDLCEAAQECAEYYAARRAIDHSCTTMDAGENLYSEWSETGEGETPSDQVMVDNGISGWYGEMEDYNYEDPGASTGYVDHGTQLLWKETTSMGMGVSTVDDFTVVVAKYRCPGNFMWDDDDDPWKLYKENVSPPN